MPIYKNGNKMLSTNYRPITVAPTSVKIMERLIVNELVPFLLDNKIIPDSQHGFLPNRSVTNNLLTARNDWTLYLDHYEPVDVVYIDFYRAFDKVSIKKLIAKLEHFGVRGELLAWLEKFLLGRSTILG